MVPSDAWGSYESHRALGRLRAEVALLTAHAPKCSWGNTKSGLMNGTDTQGTQAVALYWDAPDTEARLAASASVKSCGN